MIRPISSVAHLRLNTKPDETEYKVPKIFLTIIFDEISVGLAKVQVYTCSVFTNSLFHNLREHGGLVVECQTLMPEVLDLTRGVTIYRYIGILRYGARGTVYRYAHTRIPVYRNTVRVLY